MKIFVTGAAGQLGSDVMKELKKRGHFAVGSDISEIAAPEYEYKKMDITDRAAVLSIIEEIKPDAVIHCAAWTAVDAAEEEENRSRVFEINRDGTKNIAEACKSADCKLIYISTDYVFDGQGERPREPEESCSPLNVYGRSKLEGELALEETLEKYYIVRTAWVFGKNGSNFVRTILNAGRKYPQLRVVNDQIGTPTYTGDLAVLLADMAETDRYGIYHATNEGGYISWYDLACEVLRQAGCTAGITPVTTAEYGLNKAARPFNSRLDRSKLVRNGFKPLPHWRDALARYLKEIM